MSILFGEWLRDLSEADKTARIKFLLNFGQNYHPVHKCKKCDSRVADVGNYLEHCRTCDNWQVSF